MVFSSLFFLYTFLPLCLIVYQIPDHLEGKNRVLLAFSLLFYAWGEPVWIIQMLLSGAVIFFFAHQVEANRHKVKEAKRMMLLGVFFALIPLFVFKYSGFFVENINALLGASLSVPKLKMPIGISFYTFQIISYIVDLYRGECKLQRSLSRFWLYEALFPQLIAGPIVRYSDVEAELNERTRTEQDLAEGAIRFVSGLAKKTLLANYAGSLVEQTLASTRLAQLSGLEAWIGILAYTFQIYFDFSAYSDMAIGLGRLFGFHFKENFDYPYYSKSITEFWRRWHISLGSFFRDYVYIPLGGKYKHQLRNLVIVWFLTGFWHGASWNFILWGLYYLLFLILEKYLLKPVIEKVPRALCIPFVFFVVNIGWSLFYFTDLSKWLVFLRRMFMLDGNAFLNMEGKLLWGQNVYFFVLAFIASMPIIPGVKDLIPRLGKRGFHSSKYWFVSRMLVMLLLLVMSTAALAGESFNPFLYFRF